MSDDTPTERFNASDDAPTQRYDAAGGEDAPSAEAQEERKSRRLIIILSIIGGVLAIILIILLIVLLVRPTGGVTPTPTPTASATVSPSPTASTSPSPTPTPTPTETTPPPPPPPSPITSYTASPEEVDCSGGGPVPVTFSWATTGETLWFGVGTDDAKAEPYDSFPLNYTLDFDYQCGQPGDQQIYTITVEQSNGDVTSETITIRE